ncbi:glycosyltransferase [Vibrio cyclitrophicus]
MIHGVGKIKVIAFTSGKSTPSAIYRVREVAKYINKDSGFLVDEYYPLVDKNKPIPIFHGRVKYRHIAPLVFVWFVFKLLFRFPGLIRQRMYNIAWLNREFLPGLFTLERFLRIPIVFDFDDAIWLSKPSGKKAFAAHINKASLVIAGNHYLADEARKYNKNVIVVPTSIDTELLYPKEIQDNLFRVGWVGTSGNFFYLYSIEEELYNFVNATGSIIVITSDVMPKFKFLEHGKHWRFIKWEKSKESNFLNDMDVGIMPLIDSEWENGKCSFKMLQYMAVGKPVVVSPVGMNIEVMKKGTFGFKANKGEWTDKLLILYNMSLEERNTFGNNAREIVERDYSLCVNSKILKEHFTRIVSND